MYIDSVSARRTMENVLDLYALIIIMTRKSVIKPPNEIALKFFLDLIILTYLTLPI